MSGKQSQPTQVRTDYPFRFWGILAAGVVALAGLAAAASLTLLAPGTVIAGVSVGGLTPTAANAKIADAISELKVTVTGLGEPITLHATELGANVDGTELASWVIANSPAWDVSGWGSVAIPAAVELKDHHAETVLRNAYSSIWVNPVDATVVFDPELRKYVATQAVNGTGPDLHAISSALSGALEKGHTHLTVSAPIAQVAASISTAEAERVRDVLNNMLVGAGFYVDEKLAFKIKPATLASWITIVPEDQKLTIKADQSAIAGILSDVALSLEKEPVNAKQIFSAKGKRLGDSKGEVGVAIDELEKVAPAFSRMLASGSSAYPLMMREIAFEHEDVVRQIVVNLTTQTLRMVENDKVLDSWKISSGTPGKWETITGTYPINWKKRSITMTGYDWVMVDEERVWQKIYEVPNVKWVMQFNGIQAIHGVYWHRNWGTRMSHGCIGMPEWRAEQLYEWAPIGLEVVIHK